VPTAVVVVADILVLSGYGLFVLVLRENRYASRIIEVERQQEVIMTGPHALVRHPMYMSVSLMYVFSPLALRCTGCCPLPFPYLFLRFFRRSHNAGRLLAAG